MAIYLGIDIGTVSAKVALLADDDSRNTLLRAAQSSDLFYIPPGKEKTNDELADYILVTRYHRIKGGPVAATRELLDRILEIIPMEEIEGMRVCGSGGNLIGDLIDISYENEFRALARGISALYPGVATVLEMGGENSKYIALEYIEDSGRAGIGDYEKSGDCAAGTGSFLDQQASRLLFDIEEVGHIVESTDRSAKIAGRCSVFAKSDMIHAQQKGYTPAEVLRGLCEAVARNFKSSIVKGKRIKKPVAFVGGVAVNTGVVNAVREVFKIEDDELFVPEYYAWMAAIGTAIAEREASRKSSPENISLLSSYKTEGDGFPTSKTLSLDKVTLLRDRVQPRHFSGNGSEEPTIPAYMGIDVGSVSTNVVVIDTDGNMIKEIYTRTKGRPIEVVDACLKEVEEEVGAIIEIKAVGTTGSGRELIGKLVGADTINDEITSHKTGAEFIARTMLDTEVDTIFEIGGQDSKFISIENGVVVDFAMNEACAAGTGSFLEERAEELGIAIKNEFAEIAFSSGSPIKLGERCTVFMQQDVAAYQQRGARKEDLTAGLGYSIVYNYLNRVVRGRKIGDIIFFQGGTAYNDAIAGAFARVLDKEIIVPPYNGVVGAIGVALLAGEKNRMTTRESSFRGYSLEKIDYQLREFTCKACSNYCNMQEFTVEEEKTFWGDQCSDLFRRRQTSEKEPVIDDLLKLRHELLFEGYDPDAEGSPSIGLPRGMYVYEQLPFWNTLFRSLGFKVVLSDETNNKIASEGLEASISEPCLPIQAYHGHVRQLAGNGADYLFIPNMINAESPDKSTSSHFCPWGQTLPFMIKASSRFDDVSGIILHPPIRFREGKKAVNEALLSALKPLGVGKKELSKALDAAYAALYSFRRKLIEAGKSALDTLEKTGEIGIVLVGRSYNVNDKGLTLDIGSKLRDYYGVNIIPLDFLPVDEEDMNDINSNMYWNYGRKIISGAKIIGRHENLHIIYMTNFKCGPDSYIKHFITDASGKPFLTLQFDGHGNDAGYLTRCEAYLDSKGALRWWANDDNGSKEKAEAKPRVTA